MLSNLLYRMRVLLRHGTVEQQLDGELRSHLERQVEKYMERGWSCEEALRRARVELGGVELAKEECRDARGVRFLETLFQDVRYGLRMLSKSPGFTIVAILTLALGIGPITAIFSLINVAMLRSLPVPEPQRLVMLQYDARRYPDTAGGYFWGCPGKTDPARHEGCSFSHPMYEQIRDQKRYSRGSPPSSVRMSSIWRWMAAGVW